MDLNLIELHSLQFGDDVEQMAPWRSRSDIHEWHGRLNDFSDTAAVVQQLDLIISVDTAVAHLAGALNKPTWLLLPQNADFRWMRQRSILLGTPQCACSARWTMVIGSRLSTSLMQLLTPCFCSTPLALLKRGFPDVQSHSFTSCRVRDSCFGSAHGAAAELVRRQQEEMILEQVPLSF